MNPAATLGLYAGALALVFAAATAVGSAVGPVGAAGASTAGHSTASHSAGAGSTDDHSTGAGSTDDHSTGAGSTDDHSTADPGTGAGGTADHAASATAELAPGGLAVAADGYALELASTTQAAGAPGRLELTITGPDGEPLTAFTPSHEQELHLVVVRRDLTGYQHLHPTRDAQGTWTVPLTLAEPGPYKVFADFVPEGRDRSVVLAADLTAPGTYVPEPLPAPASETSVDGYDVALDGDLVAGTSSPLVFTVRRDGRPVTDLEPYLGAYGHLVALREGDLAYLHVHPHGEAGAGPDIAFAADVPSAATYRLFLDVAHGGEVRTAALTATATRSGEPSGH